MNIDACVTRNPMYPNTLTQECFVIDDGQPKHRCVQQAVPARYGP